MLHFVSPKVRVVLSVLICLFGSLSAQAQATFTDSNNNTNVSGCAPLTVDFLATCPGCPNFVVTGYSATPGSISSPTSQLTFPNAGTYSVTLSYTINGTPGTTTNPNMVTVHPNPVINSISANPPTVCVNSQVCFDANVSSGTIPYTYSWLIGQNLTGATPCTTYTTAGTYNAQLSVTDNNGCTATLSQNNFLQVSPPPNATFTYSLVNPNACNAPMGVSFSWTGTPQNAAWTHQWDFGAAGTSVASGNPAFVQNFPTNGQYTVTHTVDNNGCQGTYTYPTPIQIGLQVPNITLSKTTACLGDTILIDHNTPGYTYTFNSTAGPVLSVNAQSSKLVCTNAGTNLVVNATVTQGNCSTTVQLTNSLVVSAGPQFTISANQTTSCNPPLNVTFSMLDPGGNPALGLNFGWVSPASPNPVSGNSYQFTQNYTAPGSYSVQVIGTDQYGCTLTVTENQFINIASPTASFTPTTGSPAQLCAGQSVQFVDLTSTTWSTPITNWQWSFPGGTPNASTASSPTITYNAQGSYSATLTITDANGCTSTVTYSNCVKVGAPIANLTMNFIRVGSGPVCASDQVEFVSDISPNPLPSTATVQWQYYSTANPAYYSPYFTTPYNNNVLAYVMKFDPDSLGTFCVKMIVNNNGCKDSITKCNQFTVIGPVAKFNYTPDVVCDVPTTMTFTNVSLPLSGNPSCAWKFIQGNTILGTSNNCTPNFQFTNPGPTKVTLITSEGNCTDSLSKFFNVNQVNADFTISPGPYCTNSPVGFTANVSGPLQYNWSFCTGMPGGGSGNTPSVFNTYTQPGNCIVRLAVSGAGVCKDTVEIPITINGHQMAITASPDSIGCFPMPPVTLGTNLLSAFPSNTNINSYSWVINGTPASNAASFTHNFTNSGYNYVTLTTQDNNGCYAESQLRIVNSEPLALFSADNTTNCAGLPVVFTSPSVGLGGSNLQFSWNFGTTGPGSQVTTINPTVSYNYSTNGQYTVSLTVTDTYGCKDTLTVPNYINIQPFIADFAMSDTLINCPPLNLKLTPLSLTGHAIDTTQVQWIIYNAPPPAGISYLSNQYSPTIQILTPGVYSIMMIVKSEGGCLDTVLKVSKVTVLGPKADIAISPKQACPGATISLQAMNPTSDIVAYSWLLNSTVANPPNAATATAVYYAPGVYFPVLEVTNSAGCSVKFTSQDSLTIWTPPTANFVADDTIVCVPADVNYSSLGSVNGSAPINAWNWDLGVTTSALQNPSATYTNVGLQTISLTVTDANGCKDTLTKPNYVSVIENIQPQPVNVIRVSVLDNDKIAVNFSQYNNINGDFAQYIIERSTNGGAFTQIATVPSLNTTFYIDNGLATNINKYEYRMKVENGCDNVSNASASGAHVSLTATSMSGAVKLDWTPYVGWSSVTKYNVYKVFDYDTTTHVLIGAVAGNVLQYIDSLAIRCTDPISYRVEAVRSGQNAWSDSVTSAPSSFTVNGKVDVRVASVENNTVRIDWRKPNGIELMKEYVVERDDSGTGAFVAIATVPASSSTNNLYTQVDANASVNDRIYTYRITGLDSCGNVLASGRIGETILLKATAAGGTIRLVWTPYSEWKNGVLRYRIELFNSLNNEWVKIDSVGANTLSYEDKDIRFAMPRNCYRIVAVERQGDKQLSYSNESCGSLEPVVFVPTAFTPNEDGINDLFTILGSFVEEFHIHIYNHQGQKVFESQDITKSWDGKFNGTEVQEGTYTYYLTIKSMLGESKQKAGTLTLLR